MPQMGESIAEGTVVRWIKKVGDTVDRDEPLFEISTDKVDAEIPSPAAGVVSEIRVKEGETVPVNSVVAVIGSGVAAPAKAVEPTVPTAKAAEPPKASAQADGAAAAPPPPPHYHDRDEPAVAPPAAPARAAASTARPHFHRQADRHLRQRARGIPARPRGALSAASRRGSS